MAAHLSLGVSLSELGPFMEDPVELRLPLPFEKGGELMGEIVKVDHFGNLITNISSQDLGRFLGLNHPLIKVGNVVIPKLSRIYAEEEEGKRLALVNSSEMLEIAVNLARASERIGIDEENLIGASVRVCKL